MQRQEPITGSGEKHFKKHAFHELDVSDKMHVFKMFITSVSLIFLIKLRWPKTKSLYDVSF